MAELSTTYVVYGSNLAEMNPSGEHNNKTKAINISFDLGDDNKYVIIGNGINCVFYHLKDLQWSQEKVASVVEKLNPTEDLLNYNYFQLGLTNVNEQVINRFSSIGVTVLTESGTAGTSGTSGTAGTSGTGGDTSVNVEILTDTMTADPTLIVQSLQSQSQE